MLLNSKDKRLKDLAGPASLGQLGNRHGECYGWRTGRVGDEEAAQQESGPLRGQKESKHFGLHGVLFQCQLKKKKKNRKKHCQYYGTVNIKLKSFD